MSPIVHPTIRPEATASEVLEALACRRPRCICMKSLRRGHGLTHCQSHADNGPSLNVEMKNGQLVVKCFASCDQDQAFSDLLDVANGRRAAYVPVGPVRSKPHVNGHNGTGDPVVETYTYRAADGAIRFRVERTASKEFPQSQPNGEGGWIKHINGVERVLFRLPELLTADPSRSVFVTEGEKDALRLVDGGLVATTAPGGSPWLPPYSESLRDRLVVCFLITT